MSRANELFTDRSRKAIQLANQEAHRLNHEYVGTEHILLGLTKENSGIAASVLKLFDLDLQTIFDRPLSIESVSVPAPSVVIPLLVGVDDCPRRYYFWFFGYVVEISESIWSESLRWMVICTKGNITYHGVEIQGTTNWSLENGTQEARTAADAGADLP